MNEKSTIVANFDIKHKQIRLVDDGGSKVMSHTDAMALAERHNLDLILINNNVIPPACKILDLAKYRFDTKMRNKEQAKLQREKRVHIKEIQFKLNIDDHDFQTKCRNISRFISKGNKVKIIIQFKGRERQHTDIGYDILNRIMSGVDGIEMDGKEQFTGNRITAMIKGTNNGST